MSNIRLPPCPLCSKGVLLVADEFKPYRSGRTALVRCNACCQFLWLVLREVDYKTNPNDKPLTRGLQYKFEV